MTSEERSVENESEEGEQYEIVSSLPEEPYFDCEFADEHGWHMIRTRTYPSPRYPLRSYHIPWVEGVFNQISHQVTHMKARVRMDIVTNFGRTWRSWIIILAMYYNSALLTELSLYQRPLQFIPCRFTNEVDANQVMRLMCENWCPGHMECGLEEVTRFLYEWGWRQRSLGMHSVWNGPTIPMDYALLPYDLHRRGIKANRRSRLYHDRFYLDDCPFKVCVGISQERTFPRGPSPGLGLFADCSKDESVPFSDLNPRCVVFTPGQVICKVRTPRLNANWYNYYRGYWANRYIVWSPDDTYFHDGSRLNHALSFANDSLAFGHRNAALMYGPDPDGIFPGNIWFLLATTYLYTGDEITYAYGWKYWKNHTWSELSLFAWRRCCQDGEEDALRTNVDFAFAWVHHLREDFPFADYALSQGITVLESIPTQWRP